MATTQSQNKIAVISPSSSQRRNGPLHKWLANEIRNHVRQNNLEPGTPLEPEVEIAERYQVSRGTVRQAMATLVHEGLIDRIAGRGSFIRTRGDQPNSQDDANANNHTWAGITPKTNRIRVLVDSSAPPVPGHFILAESINGLTRAVSQMNGSCKLSFEYHRVTHVNDPVARQFMDQDDCEGMVILPVTQECIQFINEMGRPAKPTAVIYRHVANPHVHRFAVDNFSGAYQATDYLLRLGHRRIGLMILTWPVAWPSTLERLEGYRKAMEQAGCQDNGLVATANNAHDFNEIKSTIRRLLNQKNRPTAIMVNAANSLPPALDVLEEMKLRVPEDISLINIDESELAQRHNPAITVVHMPLMSNAQRAMETLHQAILEETPPVAERCICPELRVRQSCRPVIELEELH
jgi:DNA-binding LacI/PurR family transcriptional regulator